MKAPQSTFESQTDRFSQTHRERGEDVQSKEVAQMRIVKLRTYVRWRTHRGEKGTRTMQKVFALSSTSTDFHQHMELVASSAQQSLAGDHMIYEALFRPEVSAFLLCGIDMHNMGGGLVSRHGCATWEEW